MKGFIIWFLGFLPGIPVGFFLRWLTQPKAPKRRCKFIREGKEWEGNKFDRCIGEESAVCIEHLCPKHCQELHGDKCNQNLFATDAVRAH